MSKVKMINAESLPNIPWQERPEGLKTESPVWRYSGNPVMGRNPTPEIARIFNSAVVPWEGGFIAVLRGEQVNGIPYVYLGIFALPVSSVKGTFCRSTSQWMPSFEWPRYT